MREGQLYGAEDRPQLELYGRHAIAVFVDGVLRGLSASYSIPDRQHRDYFAVATRWWLYDNKQTRRSRSFLTTARWVGGG